MSSALVPTRGLSDDEQRIVGALVDEFASHQVGNATKLSYYGGDIAAPRNGISVPPSMRDRRFSVGWAMTAVDVMNERLEWYGWGDHPELAEVYRQNQLGLEVSKATLDALIFGCSFLVVGDGDDGEPHPLVTQHSPLTMTGLQDTRLRRLAAALAVGEESCTLYLPNRTVYYNETGIYREVEHNRGRVPVVQLENQAMSGQPGRSEITRPLRDLVDEAADTLRDMSVHRKFYAAPQRWALNIAEDAFTAADGSKVTGWETVMGRIWAVPYDEERPPEQKVELGQFASSAPTAYAEQLRLLAEQFSAQTAVPVDDLGIQRANPTSEGSLVASEKRLVRKTESRQRHFVPALDELGYLALLWKNRAAPDMTGVSSDHWRAAATPTRAAIADETVKYVGAGVLPKDSVVTWSRMGLSPAEQEQLAKDVRKARAADMMTALTQVPEVDGASRPPAVTDGVA